MDDLFILSTNRETHLEHLDIIFQRLSKFALSININKCEFCVEKLDFLGHRIDKVRTLLEPPYAGPFKVMKLIRNVFLFNIRMEKKTQLR